MKYHKNQQYAFNIYSCQIKYFKFNAANVKGTFWLLLNSSN